MSVTRAIPGPPRRAAAPARNARDSFASQRTLHEAMDCLPQGIVMFGATGRLQLVNRRYREIYGFAASQCRPGLTLKQLFKLRSGKNTLNARELKYCEGLVKDWSRRSAASR